jgi:tRNA A37 threonylcarbamoyladenosine synthetase subunit TsaC/SUA5/YrdC
MSQALLVTGPLENRQADFCQKCWPGPFSLILPSGGNLSGLVGSPEGTVAVRVPAVPSLRAVLLEVGFPVVSTSANLSGHAPHTDLLEAWGEFGQNVDGFWQPLSNKEDKIIDAYIRPSCLVNLAVWPPEVLRQGPLAPPPPD